jgi:hypothetical protein
MKCLSLWQPWASLWMSGHKSFETRSWPTSHRGPIGVHAAKKRPIEIPGLLDMLRADWEAWSTALAAIGCPVDHEHRLIGLGGLPYGCLLGSGRLTGCVRIDDLNTPELPERAFGDYTPGRFAWRMSDRHPLPTPVPYRGSQGLFEVPDELFAQPSRGDNAGEGRG